MSVSNGNGKIPMLDPEDREHYYELMRDAAADEMAGAGLVFSEGQNPYEKDWSHSFDWPKRAGVQMGEEWVEDSLDAEVVQATLVMAKQSKKTGQPLRANMKRQQFQRADIQQMREAVKWDDIRENFPGQPDPFAYGSEQAVRGIGGALGQYVPLWPGPVTRQLYWQDYWQMSAKAFEAYNHDPISWRCVHLKADFTLGRGLSCKVTKSTGTGKGQHHDAATQAWEEFWQRNKMDLRLDAICRDYCWGGEQFLRYFKRGRLLTIRSIDPASIYDIITDPEDHETVFAYHQQFQTPYQLYAPKQTKPAGGTVAPTGATDPGAAVKYIIRQILPQEIDHYKANCSNYERRGRSDLYPALGWIKRLRDYLTSHVIRADMLARICWDLEVAGNQSAIQNLRSQLFPNGQAPQPGTVFGHNTASKLQAMVPEGGSGRSGAAGDPVLDALVTMTALSAGLPKDWLNFGLQSTRAGALVATEPGAKTLEELQGTLETIIHGSFERVMRAAAINDAELEVTFPSLAAEDRKDKLDDLGTMEGNAWISKRTAGSMAAREMGITSYDFDAEQAQIAQEFPEPEFEDDKSGLLGPDGKPIQRPKQGGSKPRRQVILATKRQAAKLDITKSPNLEDVPPGLLEPTSGDTLPAPDSPDGTGRTVAGGGTHATGGTSRGGTPNNENPNSARGAQDIRHEHTRIRQSADGTVTIPTELAVELMREGRRKSDDPQFTRAAQTYREQSAANLAQLAGSAIEATRAYEAIKVREAELVAEAAAERASGRGWRRLVEKLVGRDIEITLPSQTPPTVEVNVGEDASTALREATQQRRADEERHHQEQLDSLAAQRAAEDRRHTERLQAEAKRTSMEVTALGHAAARMGQPAPVHVDVNVPEQPTPRVEVQPAPVVIKESTPPPPAQPPASRRRRRILRDEENNIVGLEDE